MAVPSQKAFHRPVLEILAQANGVVPVSELIEPLISRFTLSADDLQQRTRSGALTLRNRAFWAVSYLRSAGLLANVSRGQLYITDQGRKHLKEHPGDIDVSSLKQLANQRSQGEGLTTTESEDDTPPDELMDKAHRELRAKLAAELLENLQQIPWEQFERLTVHLLEEMGYGIGIHLGQTGDGGMDGVISQDALGLEKIYIQAKRWENTVGEPEIRNFSGSLNARGASKGVFITTSNFSATAKHTANSISSGSQTIILVEGMELAYLMIDNGVGVVTQQRYEIKKLDENYFAEYA